MNKTYVSIGSFFVVLVVLSVIVHILTDLPEEPEYKPTISQKKLKSKRYSTGNADFKDSSFLDADKKRDISPYRGLKPRLKNVANAYANAIKTPVYSKPLTNNDHAMLNPNEFISIRRLVPGSDQYSFEVVLSEFILFKPDPIPIIMRMFAIKEEPVPEVEYVRANIMDKSQILAEFDLPISKDTPRLKEYSIDYLPSFETSKGWNLELKLKVIFNLGELGEQSMTTPFKYSESVAKIIGIEDEWVDGSDLMIPLLISTDYPGLYKIKANLFSELTGNPISHLTGRQMIQSSGEVFQLKAHISALKGAKDPGPYTLQTILINRIPDNRTESPARGNASGLSFTIGKHEFDEYDDEAYEPSTIEKRRLKLLQDIGSE